MNLITLAYLIKTLEDKRVIDKRAYVLGYAYIKNFINYYLAHIGLSDFEIVNIQRAWEESNVKNRW